MNALKDILNVFWHDEAGATAIEYALVAALVSVAVIAGASLLGVNMGALFSNIANCMLNPSSTCLSGL